MAWTYKEIEITMQGASFVAEVNGKRILKPSLKAVQKEIEKCLEEKAKEVTLSLPVVILRIESSLWTYNQGKFPERIDHAVITGINPTTKEVVGIEPPDKYRNAYMLPDTPANSELLKVWLEADRAERAAKQAIEEIQMSKRFGDKVSYAEAVAYIQKQHAGKSGGEVSLL